LFPRGQIRILNALVTVMLPPRETGRRSSVGAGVALRGCVHHAPGHHYEPACRNAYGGYVTAEHEAFGLRLKTHRERRGITLESIAESTKIKRTLLAALERGDVSHFPLGIFRRAFVRSYANAIGLPAEPIVAEFVQLFPEPGEALPAPAAPEAAPATPAAEPVAEPDPADSALRLTLAGDSRVRIPALRERATAAAIDGLSILALALTLWILRASSLGVALGISAFGFVIAHGLSSGRSGVVQWIKPGQKEAAGESASQPAAPVAVLQPRGARRGRNRQRHGHGSSRRERLRRAGM
jgi:transcriptional regulator with XRE-family HTH domain